jgi:hypothetical protein
MAILDHAVAVAAVPLKDTVPWKKPKFVPWMITVVPTVPEAGERVVMAGSFTVKGLPGEVPTTLVTSTATAPVVVPAGTVQVTLVSDHVVTVAFVPLKDTVPWEKPKFVPWMITVVPTVPEAGERVVMAGSFTVKGLPTEVPTTLVTTTAPVVAPSGTVQVMAVFDHEVAVAAVPLKDTVDAPWGTSKPVPWMITVVPTVPEAGVRVVMAGGGLRVKVTVTVLLAAMFTTQMESMTEVQPFHEAKFELGVGSAVSVTRPAGKRAEQVEPQEMPERILVTVPVPVPFLATVSVPAPFSA